MGPFSKASSVRRGICCSEVRPTVFGHYNLRHNGLRQRLSTDLPLHQRERRLPAEKPFNFPNSTERLRICTWGIDSASPL